jgi:peroxiredoxin family protein
MSSASGDPMSDQQTTDLTELRALIERAVDERLAAAHADDNRNKITIVAWDGHLDRIWPTLILSTTAAASGMEVSVFFTFWGLFALAKPGRRTGKDWMTKMLSVMNPGSTSKAKLSRYNFAGMGPWMLGKIAEDYKTPHPTELLELARDMGVRLIPCQMTMDLMGLTKDDLIDGLEEPIGAATALLEMKESAIQLFI